MPRAWHFNAVSVIAFLFEAQSFFYFNTTSIVDKNFKEVLEIRLGNLVDPLACVNYLVP